MTDKKIPVSSKRYKRECRYKTGYEGRLEYRGEGRQEYRCKGSHSAALCTDRDAGRMQRKDDTEEAAGGHGRKYAERHVISKSC